MTRCFCTMQSVLLAMLGWALCLSSVLPAAAATNTVTTAASAKPQLPVHSGPISGANEIIFAARPVGDDPHWYANFSYYAHDSGRKAYCEGAKLYRFDLVQRKLTTLLADPRGGIRDPQVHYDGQKILFSYRPGGTEHYHLYEIEIDGRNLRRLTDGDYDDIEPSYVPDGGIVFVSSRCKRWVNCWLTQVAVLFRCDADGSHMRQISSNNEQDNTPWPLPDGRILYTRWEYVDRSQVHYHHLWTANPDGTSQMVWYGNYHPGTTMIDAKPIPGSTKVVASFSPGHGIREHDGFITVVDPTAGPDAQKFARRIAPDHYRDPWAFSENCFLAAQKAHLVLLDGTGARKLVCKLPKEDVEAKLQCHEPRPVMVRERERTIPSRIEPQQPVGRMVLANVYDGRNMAGVKYGEIKKLLVLESLPMPIHYTGGMEPISLGGTFTLERILGTVPVEEDGSAYFEAPAMRSLIFVALDEKGVCVKRMQSFATVQPGEIVSCVGCHEQRTQTPQYAARNLAALRKRPSQIEPIKDVPDVLDFPRDIQPILDRHCLRCHDYNDNNTNRVFLTGDRGPTYSISYYTLTALDQIADGRNLPKSNLTPRSFGSSASALMQKLEPSHHDVQLSEQEKKTIRLWLDCGAPYPGTYASLGCGMIGFSTENRVAHEDMQWPATVRGVQAIQKRCQGCHNPKMPVPLNASHRTESKFYHELDKNDPQRRISRHSVFNLTRPEKSLALLAPLAPEAGGFGFCKGRPGESAVFANTEDSDYKAILGAIVAAKEHLDKVKRFDMPGFKPRVDWVREMKRYGILAESWQPSDPIDVYAVEREYWKSLWYAPQGN